MDKGFTLSEEELQKIREAIQKTMQEYLEQHK